MNEQQDITPAQKEGIQKQFSETVTFDTVETARQFFRVARERLLDVNNWQHICGGLSSTFRPGRAGGV